MKRFVKKTKPRNIEVQAAYNGKQLSSCFETKDETKIEHKHHIIYQRKLWTTILGNQQDM